MQDLCQQFHSVFWLSGPTLCGDYFSSYIQTCCSACLT